MPATACIGRLIALQWRNVVQSLVPWPSPEESCWEGCRIAPFLIYRDCVRVAVGQTRKVRGNGLLAHVCNRAYDALRLSARDAKAERDEPAVVAPVICHGGGRRETRGRLALRGFAHLHAGRERLE